jgi:hypothetical protein
MARERPKADRAFDCCVGQGRKEKEEEKSSSTRVRGCRAANPSSLPSSGEKKRQGRGRKSNRSSCWSKEERERRGEKQFDTGKRLQSCQSLFFTFFWREEKARESQKGCGCKQSIPPLLLSSLQDYVSMGGVLKDLFSPLPALFTRGNLP